MNSADKLRLIRHARGLKQSELAERCGSNISNRDISLMETGWTMRQELLQQNAGSILTSSLRNDIKITI